MNLLKKFFAVLLIFLLSSCKDFLEINPRGVLTDEELNSPENVESLTNAAYASLANSNWFVPYENLWLFGSVRSDDTFKGGLGQSDQSEMNAMELFNILESSNPRVNQVWDRLYKGVYRANLALRNMENVSQEEYPQKNERAAEMHFVRGHFYFLLKILFKNIPFIDYDTPEDSISGISNVALSDQDLWNKIAEDFEFSIQYLPKKQQEIGRPDRYAAMAYLAKVNLYQAYEQDKNHQVIGLNSQALEKVLDLTEKIIDSSDYGLVPRYSQKFLYEFKNNEESIWAIQYSQNDGTGDNRAERDYALNYPMNDAYGCCSFNRPTQNLVNAFQTDENEGLPLFDTYNDFDLNQPADFQAHTFDPRLDHTVGIPGHPYKYQNHMIYDAEEFARALSTYGPFSNMKGVYQEDCICAVEIQSGDFLGSTQPDVILSYNDVLLMRAEALIQLNRQNDALDLINQIRERASNSSEILRHDDGTYYSNYKINVYKPGVNIDWTAENAFKALRWERRLEFATEGPRFFDLVRWGIAGDVLNSYFTKEKSRFPFLKDAAFVKGRDEYFPIPDDQIILSHGLYEQNPTY